MSKIELQRQSYFLRNFSFRWCSGQVEIITRSACEPNLPSTGLSTNIYQMPWYVLKKYERAGLGKMEYCKWKQTFSRTLYWTFFWMMKIRDWSAQVVSPIAFAAKYSLPEDDENDGANYLPLRLCFFQNGLSTSCFENTLWSLCSIYTLMSQSVSNHLLFISRSTSLCWKCLETIYMQFDSKEPFRS